MFPAYCTNVVAGRTLDETRANVLRTFGAVRGLACPGGTLPVGLWLSARALQQLGDEPGGARALRDELAAHGLAVVTLNAFPYHDFHDVVVKHRVYEPHWADVRRLLYTTALADLLPDLLPPGVREASISTVPLGWRTRFSLEGCGASVGLASAMLEQLGRHLSQLEDRSGIRVHVDLEPEPGCALDRAADVTSFFEHALPTRRGQPDVRRYVGVCHDVCHAAVMFEEQADVLRAYRAAGVRVGKVQVSSALRADGSPESLAVLAAYAEPRWLHQTCVRAPGRAPAFHEDLAPALAAEPAGEWRTHFHVPVFAARLGALGTTQDAIDACLAELAQWPEPERPLLELETYAWEMLPDAADADGGRGTLAQGIAREIEWLRGRMRAAGLAAGGAGTEVRP